MVSQTKTPTKSVKKGKASKKKTDEHLSPDIIDSDTEIQSDREETNTNKSDVPKVNKTAGKAQKKGSTNLSKALTDAIGSLVKEGGGDTKSLEKELNQLRTQVLNDRKNYLNDKKAHVCYLLNQSRLYDSAAEKASQGIPPNTDGVSYYLQKKNPKPSTKQVKKKERPAPPPTETE